MDNFREEFIKGLLETLKIPATAFNIALVSDEIEVIPNGSLRGFYREVVSADTYGNGMKAIISVAKNFKSAEKDILEGTADKAKAMYDKFYTQQSAMLDYAQAHRDIISNDRKWFKSIDYSKLKNRDGSKTYTNLELYVLKELGSGEFLINLRFALNSSHIITKIQKIINKAMQSLEKTVRGEIKKDEDKLLVASALMAVTRNLYVEAIGAEDTAQVFASIADSFFLTEEMLEQYKPTIH